MTLNVKFRIYKSWSMLDAVPDSADYMCYKIATGQVIALLYEDMRRLFVTNTKGRIVEANVKLIEGLEGALEADCYEGTIQV